jgi:hypothetical protein
MEPSRATVAGLAGTAVVALLLAGCGTATAIRTTTTPVPGTHPTATSTSTTAQTTTTTTTPTTSTTTVPSAAAWSVQTIASLPFTSAQPVLPDGSGAAYLLEQTSTAASAPEHLAAVNLSDGSVQRGPQVSAESFLVTYHGMMYVVSPAGFGANGSPDAPWSIRTVALGSMTLGPAEPLGALGSSYGASRGDVSFQPTGPTAGDLWAYADQHLELVAPSNGAVLRSIAVPAGDGDDFVEVEPDGKYVDLALLSSSASTAGEVLEYDTGTGAPAATHAGIFAVGTPALTGVPGGVWVSYRGGMDGTSVHFAEPALTDDTPASHGPPDQTRPVPGQSLPMGESVSYVGAVALITDSFGVACMAPSGTTVVSSTPFPGGSWSSTGRSWAPFAGAGHTVYALQVPETGSGGEALISVAVPGTC